MVQQDSKDKSPLEKFAEAIWSQQRWKFPRGGVAFFGILFSASVVHFFAIS